MAHETPGPGEAAHKSRKSPEVTITTARGHRLVRLLPPEKIARKARARLRHLRRTSSPRPATADLLARPDAEARKSLGRRAQVRLLVKWGHSRRRAKRIVGTPPSTFNRRRRRHGMRRR